MCLSGQNEHLNDKRTIVTEQFIHGGKAQETFKRNENSLKCDLFEFIF